MLHLSNSGGSFANNSFRPLWTSCIAKDYLPNSVGNSNSGTNWHLLLFGLLKEKLRIPAWSCRRLIIATILILLCWGNRNGVRPPPRAMHAHYYIWMKARRQSSSREGYIHYFIISLVSCFFLIELTCCHWFFSYEPNTPIGFPWSVPGIRRICTTVYEDSFRREMVSISVWVQSRLVKSRYRLSFLTVFWWFEHQPGLSSILSVSYNGKSFRAREYRSANLYPLKSRK